MTTIQPVTKKTKKTDPKELYLKICSYFGLDCIPQSIKDPSPEKDMYCKTHEEFGYFCVPYYQCDIKTNEIIIDGAYLVDDRTIDTHPDHRNIIQSKCERNLEVCCLHPSGTGVDIYWED